MHRVAGSDVHQIAVAQILAAEVVHAAAHEVGADLNLAALECGESLVIELIGQVGAGEAPHFDLVAVAFLVIGHGNQ